MAIYVFYGRFGSEKIQEEVTVDTEGMTPDETRARVGQEYYAWLGGRTAGGWWPKDLFAGDHFFSGDSYRLPSRASVITAPIDRKAHLN